MILSSVIRYRRPIFQVLLACGDAAAVCAVFWFAILARGRLDQAAGMSPLGQQAPTTSRLLTLALIFVAVHAAMGLYEIRRGWEARHMAVSVPVASGTAAALFLACCYVVQDYSVSRFIIVVLWALAALSSFLLRLAARGMVLWCSRRGMGTKRVVVVGDDAVASAICAKIARNAHLGLALVGQAIPREAAPEAGARLARGSMHDVAAELIGSKPHRVIFTLDIARHEELQSLAEHCLAHNIEVLQLPALYHSYPGQVGIRELLGMPFLSLGRQGLEGWELIIKNIADRTIAAFSIVVLSPLLAAVALGIYWSGGSPILRRARRAGKGGVPFTLLEFETCRMVAHRPAPTWFGSLVMRCGLHRLSRLFNVLAGEMSFVGPRPDTPEGLRRLSDWQRSRLSIRPGLTGLAQIRGHQGNGDLAAMIQDDLSYIDRQSLLLDAGILLTAAVRLLPRVSWRAGRSEVDRHREHDPESVGREVRKAISGPMVEPEESRL